MFIQLLLLGVLFAELLIYKNVYSDNSYNKWIIDLEKNMTNIWVNVCYNCIYFYSLSQIQYNKIIKILFTVTVSNAALFLLDKKGNNLFAMETTLDVIKERWDLIKEHWSSTENNKTPVGLLVLVDKINHVIFQEFPSALDYKESNVKFLSMELEHNGRFHKITLKDDVMNFYIVGNRLDSCFFQYYLKNKLHISSDTNIDTDTWEYKVNLIDHNVNFITYFQDKYILLLENEYKIMEINDEPINDEPNIEEYINLDSNNLLYA